MPRISSGSTARLRPVERGDAAAIAEIDSAWKGTATVAWWEDVVARHSSDRQRGGDRVGFVAVEGTPERVVGYVLGQVRSFEFGSDPCGWIFAIGVHPRRARRGVASRLYGEARRRFEALGVTLVRTMVRRDDVRVLTFFRNQGFVAGPYVELECTLREEEA